MKEIIHPGEQLIVKPEKIYAFLACSPSCLLALVVCFLAIALPFDMLISRSMALFDVFLLLYAIYRYLSIRNRLFLITDEQIKIQTGIFSIHTDYLELYRVKDYIVDEPFSLRVLGLMTFTIISVDKNRNNQFVVMRGIKKTNIPDLIRNQVQIARQNNRVYEVDNGSL
ncbi:PH domain-containing protein [Mucilaginibacter lappiensis]|uniref:Putative membrane protein YdbT with pleckstrin-like domain n=1 Tax=Mucilaginibacter lappiensis TaxID=354630 RepID=A0A841JRT1_9SPHI|nr:PH domain-containing protein [Mucilaginibacter lappiensis]MBB6131498.1 putative membrane protein YdbT with pleckstrin-like domain [Mucilaginibacter lappiensis]